MVNRSAWVCLKVFLPSALVVPQAFRVPKLSPTTIDRGATEKKEWERRVLFVLTCVAEPHVRRRCEEAKPPLEEASAVTPR